MLNPESVLRDGGIISSPRSVSPKGLRPSKTKRSSSSNTELGEDFDKLNSYLWSFLGRFALEAGRIPLTAECRQRFGHPMYS